MKTATLMTCPDFRQTALNSTDAPTSPASFIVAFGSTISLGGNPADMEKGIEIFPSLNQKLEYTDMPKGIPPNYY